MVLLLSIEALLMNGTKTTRRLAIISTTDRPLRNRKHCSQLLRVVVSSPEGSTGMYRCCAVGQYLTCDPGTKDSIFFISANGIMTSGIFVPSL